MRYAKDSGRTQKNKDKRNEKSPQSCEWRHWIMTDPRVTGRHEGSVPILIRAVVSVLAVCFWQPIKVRKPWGGLVANVSRSPGRCMCVCVQIIIHTYSMSTIIKICMCMHDGVFALSLMFLNRQNSLQAIIWMKIIISWQGWKRYLCVSRTV